MVKAMLGFAFEVSMHGCFETAMHGGRNGDAQWAKQRCTCSASMRCTLHAARNQMHGTAGWMTAHRPRFVPPLVLRASNAVSFTVNLLLALPVHRCFEEPVHRRLENPVHPLKRARSR